MSFVRVSPLEKLKYCNCKTSYITKGMSYKETWHDAYEWLTIKENIWELPWSFDWSYNNNHISKQKPLKLTLGWVCKFFWRGQFVLLQGQFVFIWYYMGVSKARPPSLCVPLPLSTGGIEKKFSLTKERDYKGGTKTLSQNPNTKYTQKSSQSREARN